MEVLTSQLDASVNFVLDNGLEARYVRREDAYFIVYLSSHNGCNKACRFCHLTQTGQTDFVPATLAQFEEQARLVLDHYRRQVDAGHEARAERVHVNWMARGEALDNPVVTGQWEALTAMLTRLARAAGLQEIVFNVSTIVPTTYAGTFEFGGTVQPVIFYSLYSLDPRFRRRWLPKAQEPAAVLAALADWQRRSGGKVVLHWAMIEGENDDAATMQGIGEAVTKAGLEARFNLVRYNPYSDGQGREPAEPVLQQRFAQILPLMRAPGSRIVPRVGFDVKASCGMFVGGRDRGTGP